MTDLHSGDVYLSHAEEGHSLEPDCNTLIFEQNSKQVHLEFLPKTGGGITRRLTYNAVSSLTLSKKSQYGQWEEQKTLVRSLKLYSTFTSYKAISDHQLSMVPLQPTLPCYFCKFTGPIWKTSPIANPSQLITSLTAGSLLLSFLTAVSLLTLTCTIQVRSSSQQSPSSSGYPGHVGTKRKHFRYLVSLGPSSEQWTKRSLVSFLDLTSHGFITT